VDKRPGHVDAGDLELVIDVEHRLMRALKTGAAFQ
jgi:hypothetical protein